MIVKGYERTDGKAKTNLLEMRRILERLVLNWVVFWKYESKIHETIMNERKFESYEINF